VLLGVQLLLSRYPGRVHVLLGNHEHAHIGGPRTSLFARDEATALEQRIGIEASLHMASFFRSLPIVAWAPVVCFSVTPRPPASWSASRTSKASTTAATSRRAGPISHAPPSQTNPASWRHGCSGQLLWEHVLPPFKAQSLLARVGAQMAVYGHTIIPPAIKRSATSS
jgi:hypothetical protein